MEAAEREALKADAAAAFSGTAAPAASTAYGSSAGAGFAESTTAGPASPPASAWSLKDGLDTVWQELRSSVSERVELLSLEAHQAALALAELVAMAILAALLLVFTWVTVLGGIVWAVISAGVPWWVALIAAIIITGGGAVLLLLRAKNLAKYMGFKASLRMMKAASKDPRKEPPPTVPVMDGVQPAPASPLH
ncbi:MAG: hypothetical protein JWQ11_504 [Rhizobacter sp.]|nr:hypothetical protein [Rhizobacter sp.]